jgi:hypothetical protein
MLEWDAEFTAQMITASLGGRYEDADFEDY